MAKEAALAGCPQGVTLRDMTEADLVEEEEVDGDWVQDPDVQEEPAQEEAEPAQEEPAQVNNPAQEEGNPIQAATEKHRTLSTLRKHELIERITFMDSLLPAEELMGRALYTKEDLGTLTVKVLRAIARREEYKVPLAIDLIAKEYGFSILWLPPYHPQLNPIELAWGASKGLVALENDGSDFMKVRDLLLKAFKEGDLD
ncbi:hypothetical protein BGZ82_002219 [Podila clonocystis]|nr:hypothetical protein BGZ82_002219 [Podila clonocystis]